MHAGRYRKVRLTQSNVSLFPENCYFVTKIANRNTILFGPNRRPGLTASPFWDVRMGKCYVHLLVNRISTSTPHHSARIVGRRHLNRARSFQPSNGINECRNGVENIQSDIRPSSLLARFGFVDQSVDLLVHMLGQSTVLTEGVRGNAIADTSFSRSRDKERDEVTDWL